MAGQIKTILYSSIIKKQILAITGLCLCGFLFTHLLGNCLIYLGADAFNRYAYTLISNPLIYPAEVVLFSLFFIHVAVAIRLVIENHQARPNKYYMKVHTGRGANFASSTMPYTGIITLVFLVTHLLHFKFGPEYLTFLDGKDVRDLYRLVMEYFADPLHVFWYIFAVCVLGVHVGHGFWSAFQSLGINHPNYNMLIKKTSKGFGVIIGLGYSALPVFCYLKGAVE